MKAKIIANKNFCISEIDNRIYGSFLEHIGRVIYEGIYEPSHPCADDMGFRQDILDFVKKLALPIVRYPGGNFVSAYNWEDGTGEKTKRPRKFESAWQSIETNQVGIDELQEWARRAGSEIMLAVNLGTRGPQEAQNLVEYCNLETDTYYANLRCQNGFKEPFHIKTWCLGNEMGGLGQIGRKTADDYGKIALETAKHMKRADPTIELAVSGSSHVNMPNYGKWDLTVLDYTYPFIEYLSIHQYYGKNGSTEEYFAKPLELSEYIRSAVAMCDSIKAIQKSDKTVHIAFDEWNVWGNSDLINFPKGQVAPHIGEASYTFEDALVVGMMLITFQNHSDRVKIACLAQLVNAIAPIMAEKNGKSWVQTIFYPYLYASLYGRGTAMRPVIECDSYKTREHSCVPYMEASVIHDEAVKTVTVFAVNRSLDEDIGLTIELEGIGNCELFEHIELFSDNLSTVNSPENQAVTPQNRECASSEILLKKHSWNMIRYRY